MLWTACDDIIVVALSRAYVYVLGPIWLNRVSTGQLDGRLGLFRFNHV